MSIKSYFMRIIAILFAIVFISCADKEVLYNKPATFWYEGIIKNIRIGDLDAADSYFSSLQSEHINSPLLPESMLILGQAHLKEKEYLLADFYFKEYLKKYGNAANADYIAYLQLKAYYYGFRNTSKDQQFLVNSILLIDNFLEKYPTSRYTPLVEQMEVEFTLGQNELNLSIMNVYKKQKKQDALDLYSERVDLTLQEESHAIESKIPWYMKILNW